MNDDIMQYLKSSDPKDRIYGMQLLYDEGHPDAMRVFARFYKKDPDPRVKQAAREFGAKLKAQESADPMPRQQEAFTEDIVTAPGKMRTAKRHLDSAMNALINANYDLAWKEAQKAFDADPSLRHDDYAVGLASDITGEARDRAVRVLMSSNYSEREADFDDFAADSSKRKRKAKAGIEDDVDFGDAMLDVSLYGLVSGALTFIGVLLITALIGNTVRQIAAATTNSYDAMVLTDIIQLINGIGFGTAILYGVSTGVSSIIGLMLYMGLIHLICVWLLNGHGTYPRLLKNSVMPYIGYTVGGGIIGVVAFIMMINSLPTDPAVYSDPFYTPEIPAAVGSLYALGAVFGLVWVFWLGHAIGKSYDFGMGKGCISLILSYVISAVFACGCYFILFATIVSSFGAASGGSF